MCDIFDRNDLNAKDYYVYCFYFSGHIFPHLENIAGETFMYIYRMERKLQMNIKL